MVYPVYPPYPGPVPQHSDTIRNVFHIVVDEEMDYTRTFVDVNPSTYVQNDLTNYTAELQVRVSDGHFDSYSDPQIPALDLNTKNGGIVLGGVLGTITVKITSAQTTNLNWNRGVYNLVLISPTGSRRQFMSGFFSVNAGATKIGQTQL